MPALEIDALQLAGLERHALGQYPEEACGILLGRADGRGAAVERAVACRNAAPPARRGRRFAIAPEELLAHHRRARALGLEVVGYYHSHPRGRARPSRRDRRTAWPGTSYLIVAVDGSGVAERRSWRLAGDGGGFVEEALEVRPEAAA